MAAVILATEQLWTGKGINMATKSEIRRDIKAFKHDTDSMMIDFAGEVIGYKILALDEYKKADIIFIYADYNKEVKTETIIKDALKNGKKVALPRVYKHDIAIDSNSGKYMKFHYIESMDDLVKGYNGIREPKEDLKVADSDTADNALMIMHIVAFDGDRNRVGYGGIMSFFGEEVISIFHRRCGNAYPFPCQGTDAARLFRGGGVFGRLAGGRIGSARRSSYLSAA